MRTVRSRNWRLIICPSSSRLDNSVRMPPRAAMGKEESQLLQILAQNPEGCTDNMLQQKMKMEKKDLVTSINKLIKAGKLELKTQGSILIYLLRDAKAAESTKGMGQEEKIVYNIIEKSGNKGIWVKEIRTRSNLQLTQLNKVLKSLESKKSIKSVKPVTDSKKKVYMLFDIKPDSSLTGGAWYSENDFETEFVDILGRQTLTFLQRQRSHAEVQHTDPLAAQRHMMCDIKQVKHFISQLGISKVELEDAEVKQILESLVFDGFATRLHTLGEGGKKQTFYRAIKHQPLTSGISRVPCGVCPIISQCTPGGLVSPQTCKYMKEWLEF